MEISKALGELRSLKNKPKYEAMLTTAAIITKLLEIRKIKPIIVGGLSVELYTQSDYTTRDIDFVSDGYDIIKDLLLTLQFKKEGRHFYREDIEISIEIPDDYLAGDKKKVLKVYLDNVMYVYVISKEDIILDRLRATIHWKSEEDAKWGFKLLSINYKEIDINYLLDNTETQAEKIELEKWIEIIKKNE